MRLLRYGLIFSILALFLLLYACGTEIKGIDVDKISEVSVTKSDNQDNIEAEIHSYISEIDWKDINEKSDLSEATGNEKKEQSVINDNTSEKDNTVISSVVESTDNPGKKENANNDSKNNGNSDNNESFGLNGNNELEIDWK